MSSVGEPEPGAGIRAFLEGAGAGSGKVNLWELVNLYRGVPSQSR